MQRQHHGLVDERWVVYSMIRKRMGCCQLQPDINESHFGHFDMPRPAGGGLLGRRSSFQAHDAPMAILRSIVTVVAAKHQPIPDRCCLPRLFSSSAEDGASQPWRTMRGIFWLTVPRTQKDSPNVLKMVTRLRVARSREVEAVFRSFQG
jgi:hypothetical protein